MKRSNKNHSLLLIILVSFFIFSFGCGKRTSSIPKIGDKFPDFKYIDMEGKKGSITALKGNLILVRFWADWCPYCRVEMPVIDKIFKEYEKKGFSVLAVSVKQSREKVEAFVAELNLSFPVILDKDARIAKLCGVRAIPTNFIVDRNGIVRKIIIGEVFKEKSLLRKTLAPYL